MIIDKNGKLFGKISIVDILILLVIVVGAAGTYFTLSTVNSGKFKDNSALALNSAYPVKNAEVTFEVKGVRQVTKDGLIIGDEVYATKDGEKFLGVIKEMSSEPATRYLALDDGSVYEAVVPEYFNVKITLDVTGKDTETGFHTESGVQLLYSKGIEMRTSTVKTSFLVTDIEYK